MANYAPSTRARIADLILGMHVETTAGILLAANFTATAQTELFNIYGRIGVTQLFIELTVAAAAEATVVQFNCTFTTPVVALNSMCANSVAITSLAAGGRIVYRAGMAVATLASISDSAGLTDISGDGVTILGGEGFIGTIGMLASTVTQTGTIAATGHLFYVPMSPGAYATAAL